MPYFQRKKSIKIDKQPITSYKQILSHFQVITLTEDIIDIIRGYPATRRAFIDQAVLFSEPDSLDIYSKFKHIVQHRNALLVSTKNIDVIEFETWTYSLWEYSIKIQLYRRKALENIEKAVNLLLNQYFEGIYSISLQYESKHLDSYGTFDNFMANLSKIADQERILKRSLFGAHLDDIYINVINKKARNYASRGQQKLIAFLCKTSLSISNDLETLPILLIDDFISDFDKIRLEQMSNFLVSCKNQVILTIPTHESLPMQAFAKKVQSGLIFL